MQKLPFAAFTVAREETFFLNVWCNYYCSQFGAENCYVIKDVALDLSIQRAVDEHSGLNVIDISGGDFGDPGRIKPLVMSKQKMLLDSYECVLFSEADEYIVPDNCSLKCYCQEFLDSNDSFRRSVGWGVVHQVDFEPVLDLSRDCLILENRSSMWQMPRYDKTLLSKVPLTWSAGFHHVWEQGDRRMDIKRDPALKLFHAWQVDVDVWWQRWLDRKKFTCCSTNKPHGCDNFESVKQFFRTLKAPWDNNYSPYNGNKANVPASWLSQFVWNVDRR
jgi:hypothetical protein